jgi:GxxExxY protein
LCNERGSGDIRDNEMEYKDDLLTDQIIQSIIQVHKTLGPGFLETIYRKALLIELNINKIDAKTEKEMTIFYKNKQVGIH